VPLQCDEYNATIIRFFAPTMRQQCNNGFKILNPYPYDKFKTKMSKNYNPKIHHRRSIRLKNYDYAQDGAYFATICAQNKEYMFGNIIDGKMVLNSAGEMIKKWLLELKNKFKNIELDEYIIMPNHIHGIIIIETSSVGAQNVGAQDFVPLRQRVQNFASMQQSQNVGVQDFKPLRCENKFQHIISRSLGSIIRGFKIGVTKLCVQNNYEFQWQKSFYDHVIRDEKSLEKIREYIANNPLKWELDKNNLENLYM
jgi:putative transposase